MVCVREGSASNEERRSVSEQIVASRCRYAVCWGHKLCAWDAAIDLAYISIDRSLPAETFVTSGSPGRWLSQRLGRRLR